MKQYTEDNIRYSGAMGSQEIWVPGISEEVFADKWDYGSAFAYLWRRFGPPFEGWDGHKELVSYYLTTDTKGVLLYVSPKPNAGCSFGYSLSAILKYKLRAEYAHSMWQEFKGRKIQTPRADKINKALRNAMEELKRYVFVRDWPINIQGHVDDYIPDPAKPSKYAGYGITPDYFDKFNEIQEKD